ncbi:Nucleolar protein 10 [Portunus trituberculatus]|uniref:Nucleolar protein 10 n=1 Tax=Portunus trituberculatus TaxID=210409 RepID=A0A5B7DX36_PORTR|nr:Nucleolar protein 10 [Portunus trituberculatus]
MPDVSGCVRVSPDGRYILATGTYKPRVKCYEVAALSLKFERCFDSEVIQFDILSDDYSKLVFLQEDRFVEFHSQAGRWFRMRIPKFGRDLAYHYPSCDLYIAASGSDIYRLNLQQGRFLNSLQTEAVTGVNKCAFHPSHYLFVCGTEDGRVEAWDPRSRHRVGTLDCAAHMAAENVQFSEFRTVKQLGVTALAYSDALTLGVGTQTGQVLLYDIRSNRPLLVKDHNDGYAIRDLEFHNTSGMALSMSSKVVKIWNKATKLPNINRDLFERLLEDKQEKNKKRSKTAETLLKDDRFSNLFSSSDFHIDKASVEYQLINPVLSRMDKKKKKQKLEEEEEEQAFLEARGDFEDNDSSDSDSIMSDFGDDKPEVSRWSDAMPRMPLSERLGMEDIPGESIKQHSFGSREMNYVIKKAPKFERMRQQQKEHQEERRKIRRSTNKLKGKFRIKEPL